MSILSNTYKDFGAHIRDKAAIKKIPVKGSIEITHRCNLSCVHCYCDLPNNDKRKKEELTYHEICNLIDAVVREGCLWFTISGGEPLIRPDFMDIYAYAKSKGLLVTVFTNGTLVNSEIAEFFKQFSPFSVEITLYGITEETYEKVTRVKGSFQRCMKGIQHLVDLDIKINLKTMVMTLNKHEVLEIKRYADSRGLDCKFDPLIFPRLDGSKGPCSLRISPEEVIKLDVEDSERHKMFIELAAEAENYPISEYLYTCPAARSGFNIDPYGNLSVCSISRSPSFDLRKGSFHEARSKFFRKVYSKKASKGYKCRVCRFKPLCYQCPGLAQLEHGHPEAIVDYLCQIGHLRAQMFSLKQEYQGGEKNE